MSCLSILKDDVFVVCANPIFLTSEQEAGTLTFEVFEAEAGALKSRVGITEQYCVDSGEPFFGQLAGI